MSAPLLEVKDVRSGYGAVEILRGVGMQLHAGELVALLGSNGAGKTTLNNVLSGVLPTWAGQVHFDGQLLTGQSYTQVVRAGLIHVPEGRKIFPNLSVLENLQLGAYARARERREHNLAIALETFPRLKERLSQLAGTMSGGEQQMLAIGRGMMAEPKLLILDEPSLGLSPLLVEELFGLIQKLRASGLTILLVEQNANLALKISHRAYVLTNGEITLQGTSSELLSNPEIKKAYLGS